MTSRRLQGMAGAAIVFLLIPRPAHAQPDLQLWTAFKFQWNKSHRMTLGVEAEPKVLVWAPASEPQWATLDVTPSVDYKWGPWLDAVGELMVGRTRQTDHLNSSELTPRVGFRFHLLSNLRNQVSRERLPKRRLVLRNFLRLEYRNLYYSTDEPDSHTLRLRNRLETLWPINRHKITDDGVTYLSADWEWFVPVDDPAERYASRQRTRTGVGYRRNAAWSFAALFVWNRSRNTVDEPFTTSDYAIDLAMKRVW